MLAISESLCGYTAQQCAKARPRAAFGSTHFAIAQPMCERSNFPINVAKLVETKDKQDNYESLQAGWIPSKP